MWRAIAPPGRSGRRVRSGRSGRLPSAHAGIRSTGSSAALAARGLQLLLSASPPMPVVGLGVPAPPRHTVCKPDARGVRPLPARAGDPRLGRLPGTRTRAAASSRGSRRWSFSNEPTSRRWLRPQFARREQDRSTRVAAVRLPLAGPRRHRGPARATGHAGDEMLLGETGPIGRVDRTAATRPAPPSPFLRTLFCLAAAPNGARGRAR